MYTIGVRAKFAHLRIPRHFRDFVPFVRVSFLLLISRATSAIARARNGSDLTSLRSLFSLLPAGIRQKFPGGKIHKMRTYTFARHFGILSLTTTLLYLRPSSRLASKTWSQVSRRSVTELFSRLLSVHDASAHNANELGNPTAGQLLENCSFGFVLFYRANFLPSPLSSFPGLDSLPLVSLRNFPSPILARTKFNTLLLAWFRLAMSRSRARHLCTEHRV